MEKNNKEIFEKVINDTDLKHQSQEILDEEKRMQIKTIKLLKIILKYIFITTVLMLIMLIISIKGFENPNFNQDMFIRLFLTLFIIFVGISTCIVFVIILKNKKI